MIYLHGQMKTTRIGSETFPISAYLGKVYANRGLISTLAARDIKIRYAQTSLGLLWAIVQPLTGVAIFSFFFSYLVNIDTGNIPYPLIAMTGIVSWNFFSFIVNAAGTSLISSQTLIKKVSFPKISLLLSKVLIGMVELAVSLTILIIWMVVIQYPFSTTILLLPLILLLNTLAGLAIALWLSALTVRVRDLQHLIPFLITFGIWLTPVFYPSTLIPAKFSFIVYLNPMAAIIEWLRYSILGTGMPDARYIAGLLILLALFVSGLYYFKNTEKSIPDYI
jgi:lipopolysaccharide transport system permease protein